MCGIAGIYFKRNVGPSDYQRFRSCAKLLEHRGPDANGEHISDRLMLVHYRLSIIDLSERANQPFHDAGNNGCLVFNGEIYNFRDLARSYGMQTDTTSDTEVLSRLFSQKDIAALAELNGIFSFAHWDPNKHRILLARDRFGVKPLYYIDNDEFFAFASEAKVLIALLDRFQLNREVLSEYLWFGTSIGEDTMIKGIRKVPPGHYLEYRGPGGTPIPASFWSVETDILPRGLDNVDYNQAASETRRLLEEAVERQCISDVPVGAYLSGGIDSSIIVALASRHLGSNLDTFSVEFEGATVSELPLAALVARRYKTNHHEIRAGANQIEEALERIVFQYDEPFADPAALPLYLLARNNRSATRVVLQGDGADELFGGYGRHLDTSQFWRRRIAFLLASAASLVSSKRSDFRNRARQLWASPAWRRMALLVSGVPMMAPTSILADGVRQQIANTDPFRKYRDVDNSLTSLDPLQRMLLTDMQVVLPNTFLEKVDKVSMMHSIEARVPFLDNELADYVMRLPGHLKLSGGRTKSLLRDACQDLIPPEILAARKVSFGTPMRAWLRGGLYDTAVSAIERGRKRSEWLLDIDRIESMVAKHRAGAADYSSSIWRAVVLLIWLERHHDKIEHTLN